MTALSFYAATAQNSISDDVQDEAPVTEIGDFTLSTQALGQFGTVPHQSISEGQTNYYAQFSLWVGACKKNDQICVTSGDEIPCEWMPVPLTWNEDIQTKVKETTSVHQGQFTDVVDHETHKPLGLLVTVTSYGFSKKGYALYDFKVMLQQDAAPLNGCYIGLAADIDVPGNEGDMIPDNDLLGLIPEGIGLYVMDGGSEKKSDPLLGVALLSSDKPILTWWAEKNAPETDEERYQLLRGISPENQNVEEEADCRFLVSDGPYDLQPGETIQFTVAVLQAKGGDAFRSEASAAKNLFKKGVKEIEKSKKILSETESKLTSAPIPANYQLHPCYPNPFNSQTQIAFDLPEAQEVKAVVYNMLGQPVKQLLNNRKEAGTHTLTWDGADNNGLSVVSGLYILQMNMGQRQFQQKLILTK